MFCAEKHVRIKPGPQIFRLVQNEKKNHWDVHVQLPLRQKKNREEILHFHPEMSDDRNLSSILFFYENAIV